MKIFYVSLLVLYFPISNCHLFDKIAEESKQCEDICANTYPLHTYPAAENLISCQRGCRLFTLIEASHMMHDTNTTKQMCSAACADAYLLTSERVACDLGCTNQQPFAPFHSYEQTLHFLTPLFSVHSLCGSFMNHFNHLRQVVTSTFTFYFQPDNGKVVVVKEEDSPSSISGIVLSAKDLSPPDSEVLMDEDEDELFPEGTVVRPMSLPKAARIYGIAMGGGGGSWEEPRQATNQQLATIWLGCMPRWLLVASLFLGVLVLVWLCCLATTTPTSHCPSLLVSPPPYKMGSYPWQKVSLLGEDEMPFLCKPLQDIDQEQAEAPPLPVKVIFPESNQATPVHVPKEVPLSSPQ